MDKKVDDNDERRNSLEEYERQRAARREERRRVRAKVAELEECDPRDEVPKLSVEVDQRIQDWTLRVLQELPFADALHLLARSSDEGVHFESSWRLKRLASERFEPAYAQLFIDALDLAAYFTNVTRWTAATLSANDARRESLLRVLEPAHDRVMKARSALGDDRERSFRRDAFVALEDMYALVRESKPAFRPLWIDDPALVETQLSIHAKVITDELRASYPTVCERLKVEHIREALFAWVGYANGAFSTVSDARKAAVFVKLAKHTTAAVGAGSLENEFRAIRRDDFHFERPRNEASKRVPPSSEG